MCEQYEDLNFDGLERRANYRTIVYREDILRILDKKDSAAIVFQIIYRWLTEYKRDEVLKDIGLRKKMGRQPLTPEQVEDRMWVYMSYNDFVRESGHALGYNTVIRALDYLINTKNVIEQRKNHDPRFPDFEYRINKQIVAELLSALPKEPAFTPKIPKKKECSTQMGTPEIDSTQMGIQAQGSTQMGIDSTQMGTEVYPNGCTSHIYTHNYTHNTENSGDADAITTNPQTLLEISEEHPEAETENEPEAEATPKRKRQRKIQKKTDNSLADRVEAVYICFEGLYREVLEEDEFEIPRSSARSEVHKAIVGLIGAHASAEWLRRVFMDMWNEQNKDGTYFWRDLKRLTIPAVCNNYASRVASLKFQAKRGSQGKGASTPINKYRSSAPTEDELREDVLS
jgi:hypothetical protein